MKIVAVSMVRNEADIIEAFVRYHCRIFDAILIVDHASIDGTSEILDALRSEGLPLYLTKEHGAAHDQSRVITRAAKLAAAAHGADLVVPLDADEFLISPGGPTPRAALELLSLTANGYYRAPWITYVPTAGDPLEERNVLKRIRHRRKSEPGQYWKAIVPGKLMRKRTAVVGFGNHRLKKYGWIWHRKHRHAAAPGLAIAHFPVRSSDQLVRKVLLGWTSHLARTDKRRGENGHWEPMYQKFRRGHVPKGDELSALALSYAAREDQAGGERAELVYDPLPSAACEFELKYDTETVPLLMHLTASMEQLAQKAGRTRSRP